MTTRASELTAKRRLALCHGMAVRYLLDRFSCWDNHPRSFGLESTRLRLRALARNHAGHCHHHFRHSLQYLLGQEIAYDRRLDLDHPYRGPVRHCHPLVGALPQKHGALRLPRIFEWRWLEFHRHFSHGRSIHLDCLHAGV